MKLGAAGETDKQEGEQGDPGVTSPKYAIAFLVQLLNIIKSWISICQWSSRNLLSGKETVPQSGFSQGDSTLPANSLGNCPNCSLTEFRIEDRLGLSFSGGSFWLLSFEEKPKENLFGFLPERPDLGQNPNP